MSIERILAPLSLACLALALILSPAALAEEKKSKAQPDTSETKKSEDPTYFERVTVTATGQKVDTLDTAVSVTVIDKDEVDRRAARNAIDLIRNIPGVDVNGVGGNQARPVIRGQRGLRVLVMENGLRLNNPRRQTDFGEIASLVSLDNAEAVEVVRGPASVLYGTDAIGGVVNVLTETARFAPGTLAGELGARYGSNGDRNRFNAKIGGNLSGVDFQVGVYKRQSDNYDAPSGTFGDIRLSSDQEVLDTGIDDDGIFAQVGIDVSTKSRVSLDLNRYQGGSAGFGLVEPDAIGDDSGSRVRIYYPFQNYERWTLRYEGESLESPLLDSISLAAYSQSNERELVNDIGINLGPFGPPGTPDSTLVFDTTNFTDVDTLGVRAEARKMIGKRNLLTYGIDANEDESRNTDLSIQTFTMNFSGPPFSVVDVSTDTIANTPNATNTSYALFVQDDFRATERLSFTVGGRYQNVETTADPTPGLNVDGLDFKDDQLVGAASALFKLNDSWRLNASYGTAFRAPNIIERLFNGPTPEGFGYQIVNQNLVSETSDNVEVGFKYRNKRSFLDFTVFRNDVADGIVQVFLTPAEFMALPQDVQDAITATGLEDEVVQQRNVSELRYEGFEVAGGFRFDRGWVVGGNFTHVDAENIALGTPGSESAGDRANAWVRWNPESNPFWGEYRIVHNDGQRAPAGPNIIGDRVPEFTVHTLAAGIRFKARSMEHLVSVTVENLTDELYAEFSNALFFRPEPGRGVTAEYKVRF